MCRAGDVAAAGASVRALDPALAYIARHAEPLVVKASGLAAGKGVVICATRAVASRTARAMLVDGAFGAAGREGVIEEWLDRGEPSVLALADVAPPPLF